MRIHAVIVDGPLAPARGEEAAAGAGAVLRFEGIARGDEAGRAIAALEYETYDPMAVNLLRRLAVEMGERHGLIAVRVEHSRGRVPVGACSFRLEIESAHRGPGIAAMTEFIDRMKRDVPIWKRPVFIGRG
jgi:molybdopterin synthase catalytic subunit